MKRMIVFLIVFLQGLGIYGTSINADRVLEPFIYSENFENRTLGAWASYPLWQDTGYDPNIRINTIVPRDPNISLEQIVTPYTNVDNYAGAQKLLDMYLDAGSTITFRYYLKTDLPVEFLKVRLAAGPDGKVDFTVHNPPTGRWEWQTVSYNDFIRENLSIAGKKRIEVNALAVLAKIPFADPAMPIYLGLDDVVFKGMRTAAFQFSEPQVYKLSEWKPYIPTKHYRKGDTFMLRGSWPFDAGRVAVNVVNFTDRSRVVYTGNLKKSGGEWSDSIKLSWPEGLYLATLTALRGGEVVSETRFTVFIVPQDIGGKHPRLWFDRNGRKRIKERLALEKFKDVSDNFVAWGVSQKKLSIVASAKSIREDLPPDKVVFDLDQFPEDDGWLDNGRHRPWFGRVHSWKNAVFSNALAYGLFDDREAGVYAKDLLVKLCKFPNWEHPWFIKRGVFYLYVGEMGIEYSVGYDLLYDLMNEDERKIVRQGIMRNVVSGVHEAYVENNFITNNTCNWIAHVTGGSLMCQAAMYGDGPDVEILEPYLTGAIFKDYDLIQKSIGCDGAYGEGWGYYNYSMQSWSKSLPALENVFNVDMSLNFHGSYKEIIWASTVQNKKYFYFGDSGGGTRPMTNFAWLLPKYKDPLLGWFYNYLKDGETLMDVFYDSENVARDDPFDENPVKVFREVGTTVFKSGWEPDDFIFVLRTGPFYNHQHIDQGTFWLADRGSTFIEERHGSTYYDDPVYQPWYTQPVAHSTILIDHNHQSQRVGDCREFADGFHDHAFVYHFLDGKDAAFVSGDITRLYWDKVKSLRRNVLYLKPRTLLMLDTIVPAEQDVDVTLLYQTTYMKDISANQAVSTITKGDNILFIKHLAPEHLEVATVETPHYLGTVMGQNPLIREGMLTVTARTDRIPGIMANLLITTAGEEPEIITETGDRYIYGSSNGIPFAFSTRLNSVYEVRGIKTDALALTWNGDRVFAALCTSVERDGVFLIESDEPVTCEITAEALNYNLAKESEVKLGVGSRPSKLTVNGKSLSTFVYDAERRAVVMNLPAGEGRVVF